MLIDLDVKTGALSGFWAASSAMTEDRRLLGARASYATQLGVQRYLQLAGGEGPNRVWVEISNILGWVGSLLLNWHLLASNLMAIYWYNPGRYTLQPHCC